MLSMSMSISHPSHSVNARLQTYLRICDLEGSAVLEGLLYPWYAFVLIHLEGLIDLLGGSVVWQSMNPVCQNNCIMHSIGRSNTACRGELQGAKEEILSLVSVLIARAEKT